MTTQLSHHEKPHKIVHPVVAGANGSAATPREKICLTERRKRPAIDFLAFEKRNDRIADRSQKAAKAKLA